MPLYDFISQRLFTDNALTAGVRIELDRQQANYLLNVLRLRDGAPVLLFNGEDGEWRATIESEGRKKASLIVEERTRDQTPQYDLHYLFAPLKQARLEYMVQKAVEMGVGVMLPVMTQYTQMKKLNLDKMNAHAIEAAEQCGILSLPEIRNPAPLIDAVQEYAGQRKIIFCDEGDAGQNPIAGIQNLRGKPLAVLIGPEGGFSEAERQSLNALPHVTAIPLGPRVLRADTAAVAALALVQAIAGDWH